MNRPVIAVPLRGAAIFIPPVEAYLMSDSLENGPYLVDSWSAAPPFSSRRLRFSA
jgi:hypothetical protein